jgi:hypothetical protein
MRVENERKFIILEEGFFLFYDTQFSFFPMQLTFHGEWKFFQKIT